jgi:hypothetical protein
MCTLGAVCQREPSSNETCSWAACHAPLSRTQKLEFWYVRLIFARRRTQAVTLLKSSALASGFNVGGRRIDCDEAAFQPGLNSVDVPCRAGGKEE